MSRSGLLVTIAAGWLMAGGLLQAETTTNLSDAQIQGRDLASTLLRQAPLENYTNTGVLKIKDGKGRHSEIPVRFTTVILTDGWTTVYQTLSGTNGAGMTNLTVFHQGTNANQYQSNCGGLARADAAIPFAGSDFWACDLGLEFFHWPEQRVLKKEIRRSRGCVVLESVNPDPKPGAYMRVETWIDQETDGIVQARAWGADGQMVKEFDPKEFKKVNGQWQLQEMEISNPQTHSRTRLEFDLPSP
jgi:hypothetical protein